MLATAMSTSTDDRLLRRRARKWRLLLLLAGAALASAFFMPAVPGCSGPIIPARELYGEFSVSLPSPAGIAEIWARVDGCLTLCLIYGAAYLFGAAAAVGAAIRWRRRKPTRTLWGSAGIMSLLIAVSLGVMVAFFGEVKSSGWWPPFREWSGFMAIVGACVLAPANLIYAAAAIRLRGRVALCLSFVGAFDCLWWFITWFVPALLQNAAYYGLYVSVAASFALLVAIVGEAAALTGQSRLRTLGQLLTCRLAPLAAQKGLCPRCDYFLYGLTEQRCPECGRPFTFAELNATPAELGFGEDSPRRSGL